MSKNTEIFDENAEKDAPLLNGISKSNPFTVPDGYFDALPSQIMQACREGGKRKPAFVFDKVFWLFRPQWILAIFIAVVGICIVLRQGNNNLSYETIAASLPDSVIMQHLQNNIDYVDVNNLEELALKQDAIGSLQDTRDTANRQIMNYLINNNIDASDIENEL